MLKRNIVGLEESVIEKCWKLERIVRDKCC